MKNKLKYKWELRFIAILFFLCSTSFVFSQSVLFEGPATLPLFPVDPPTSGPGTRMMWYPDKAAFRVGIIDASQWNKDNIGENSMAWGRDIVARGIRSSAWGQSCVADKAEATAWGSNTKALAVGSTAWGTFNEAIGQGSTVWGFRNLSKSYLETVFGQYNDTLVSSTSATFVSTDHIFVIGNGTDANNRSNALEVYKNGNMKVGGALAVKSSSETIISDDQSITVDNRSFIKVVSDGLTATTRTILLSDGLLTGQILYLQNSGPVLTEFELQDSGNTKLSGTHQFRPNDIIQLIWDGNNWVEVHFSDN